MDTAAQIASLVAAIAAMAGFIVWLFKDALGRADKAAQIWREQSNGWQKVAETEAQSNRDLTAALADAIEELKRLEPPGRRGTGK